MSNLAPISPRKPFKPGYKPIKRDVEFAKVGLGEPLDAAKLKAAGGGDLKTGLGAVGLLNIVKGSMDCPAYTMDTIHQVRWTILGPISDAAIEKNFSSTIDLFGNSKSVEGVAMVESTMPQNGELNTHMLACAIGMHLEPEPMAFTAQGNAWSTPIAGQAKPPSPDVFTVGDVVNGALGANFSGQNPTQILRPAVLEWGWFQNYVAWHMVRAYDLRWAIGTKYNILDEVLRHTAYMPPSGQDGSSGFSEVDVFTAIRRANDYYEGLGSPLVFLPIDFVREGVLAQAPGGPVVGEFRPSRAFELSGVTYGGMDLRHQLRGNSEFRKLDLPYIIGAGIPIGLYLQETDSSQGDIMRDYLSISGGRNGNGAFPQVTVPAANINAGATVTGANVMLEQALDGAFPVEAQQVYAERYVFKMGDVKLSLLVKGRELDGDLYTTLKNNPEIREALCSSCECGFVNQ